MAFDTAQFMIREFTPDDSLEELTELLHRAYKQLADMGLKYVATYQSPEITQKRIRKGICFLGFYQDRLIATLTYKPPASKVLPEHLHIENTAWLEQLGVEPSLQQFGIANRLMEHAEQYARKTGVPQIALDTAEPAKHLVQWYERRGYVFDRFIDWEVTNYRSVIMIKKLTE